MEGVRHKLEVVGTNFDALFFNNLDSLRNFTNLFIMVVEKSSSKESFLYKLGHITFISLSTLFAVKELNDARKDAEEKGEIVPSKIFVTLVNTVFLVSPIFHHAKVGLNYPLFRLILSITASFSTVIPYCTRIFLPRPDYFPEVKEVGNLEATLSAKLTSIQSKIRSFKPMVEEEKKNNKQSAQLTEQEIRKELEALKIAELEDIYKLDQTLVEHFKGLEKDKVKILNKLDRKKTSGNEYKAYVQNYIEVSTLLESRYKSLLESVQNNQTSIEQEANFLQKCERVANRSMAVLGVYYLSALLSSQATPHRVVVPGEGWGYLYLGLYLVYDLLWKKPCVEIIQAQRAELKKIEKWKAGKFLDDLPLTLKKS